MNTGVKRYQLRPLENPFLFSAFQTDVKLVEMCLACVSQGKTIQLRFFLEILRVDEAQFAIILEDDRYVYICARSMRIGCEVSSPASHALLHGS